MNDPSHPASQPRGAPCPRQRRKGCTSPEVPGPGRLLECWCEAPESAGASRRRRGAGGQSWGQAGPTDPAGWPRPGAARRPHRGGRSCPRLLPPGDCGPFLRPRSLRLPHSPLPSPSQRDGLGAELCLQVQVLRDLVLHPVTVAAAHRSDARQGQLRLGQPRRPGGPVPSSRHRKGSPELERTDSRALIAPPGRALGSSGARWEVPGKKISRGTETLGRTDLGVHRFQGARTVLASTET